MKNASQACLHFSPLHLAKILRIDRTSTVASNVHECVMGFMGLDNFFSGVSAAVETACGFRMVKHIRPHAKSYKTSYTCLCCMTELAP